MRTPLRGLVHAIALAVLLLGGSALRAQQSGNSGTIVGFAYDAANGTPVPQVSVEIAGPATFNVKTDIEGGFMLNVPPGTYTVTYNSQRYLPSTVEGVIVAVGEAADASTVLANTETTTTVDVVATVAPEVATAETLLIERKLADTVSDSISGEEIKQGTASDAAGALEKVTGVSVVGKGYVYVRGLGERYSATTLNNSMLASTEPERRVVPLDLFPSNLIDNIKVLKTYSPDLQGEFSAGLVQIETVEFPTRPTFSVSYNVDFNSRTTGKSFLDYPGGGRDFFGFDDGSRDLPSGVPSDTRVDRFNYSASELQTIGRSFSDNWERRPVSSARPSQSWNIVAGNSWGKLGVVGAVTFSNSLQSIFDQDRIFYLPNPDAGAGRPASGPPIANNIFNYDESTNNVRLGGALNVSYQFSPEHKVSVKNFLSRDTDNETRYYTGFHNDFETIAENQRLRWIERQILSTQVEGEHLFPWLANSIFTWRYSYSESSRDEPDLRESLYLLDQQTDTFEFFDDAQSAFRMFNNLDEKIHNPSIDFMTPFYGNGITGSIKVGANLSFRDRDFRSRRFRLAIRGGRDLDRTLPPNELFGSDNIRPTGFELGETTRVTDAYLGTRDVFGYYGMIDIKFKQRWRIITGLRIEDVDQDVTTFDQFDPLNESVQESAPFAKTNFLPAFNLIYEVAPKQNIRAGFSQTVSRPDFRELARFGFLDLNGGRETSGNPNLVQTEIRNYDLRWEYFPGGNQLLAATLFYKQFKDPIESTVRPTVGLLQTFDNADSATNWGFELEMRRNLEVLTPTLREFSVSTNFTFVDSNIDLTNVQNLVLTNLERPMQGQSRYVGNAIVEWAKPKWRSTSRFYLNYFSNRIQDVGALGLPDIEQQGVTTLDFVYELNLLPEQGKWKLRFSAENLTDAEWLWLQGGQTFQRYTLGRTIGIGTSFRIF